MKERMATYRGEIDTRPNPMPREAPEQVIAYGERSAAKRKRPRILRHFVARGGQLVEVESIVRETR